MKLSVSLLFKFLFLLLTVSFIVVHTTLHSEYYSFWIFVEMLTILSILFLIPKYFNKIDDYYSTIPVLLYLLWSIVSVLRGFLIADNYWEWKNLTATALILLIPLFVYVSTNKNFFQEVINFWLKYALVIFILFLPFVHHSGFYGRYLAPIMLLLLLLPLLPYKWRALSILLSIFVVTAGLDSRSDVIRFSMAGSLGMLYYFRVFIGGRIIKTIHIILIILPVLLLSLAFTDTFNIFNMDKYIDGKYTTMSNESGTLKKQSLTSDTRTFIYVETINSAIKNDYVLQGRTPANGYDSKYFGGLMKWKLGTGKEQRFSSEVSILNVFTWSGLIGVLLYFLVFFRASYLAIYKSNSFFMKIIGLFVTFRWAYSFVEDFTKFDVQYILLWMLIAMCYSTEFRKMNDEEFKEWTLGLLPNFVYGRKY